MIGTMDTADRFVAEPSVDSLGLAGATNLRTWLSERKALIWMGSLIAMAFIVASSAAQTDLLLPQSVRPVPRWLAGAFGNNGIDLKLGGLIVVLAMMFVSYAAVVHFADRLSVRAVLIGILGLHALVLLAPPLLSTDVFSYTAYGRIGAIYAINPYVHGPSAIALDPLYPFVGAQWVTTPTAYGPLFTALSYVLAPLTIAANVMAYKAIAALSSLAIVALVWRIARLRDLNPVKAIAVVGLNPVLVVYGVGGGHNDLLMLAILLTGVYVLLRQHGATSGALIVAATAVKLTAGLLLPFVLAQSVYRRHGDRRRAVLAGAGAAAGLTAIFSVVIFGTGPLHILGTLQGIQARGGINSVSGLLLSVLGLEGISGPVGLVLDAGFVIGAAWLLRRVWRGELDWLTGAGWATVGLLVTAGFLLPWYVGWLVPLAALGRDRRLSVTAMAMTGLCLTTL